MQRILAVQRAWQSKWITARMPRPEAVQRPRNAPPARESCGWRLPESVQCLSVTKKYRDHLAARGQDDNLTFMGYRGTKAPRTPSDWHGQRSGRPRSYSARPATGQADDGANAPGGSGGASPGHGADDDDAGYGTGEWAAGHRDDAYGRDATQGHDAAARGPARGFPPVPGQPDPTYPHDDFEAWSDGTMATGGHAASGEWAEPAAPAAEGQWDAPRPPQRDSGTRPPRPPQRDSGTRPSRPPQRDSGTRPSRAASGTPALRAGTRTSRPRVATGTPRR